ncbi:hypothetical protein DDI_3623 [Dickeya dianthicola RNS04.9]|nr:hypothetical protein DDI_3623 [Dickeya dianthicola RNS04.9]
MTHFVDNHRSVLVCQKTAAIVRFHLHSDLKLFSYCTGIVR